MHHLPNQKDDKMTNGAGDDGIDPSFQYPPPLDSHSNEILLDQFYENVNYYLINMQKYQISELRNEVYDMTKNRSLFQAKVFGKSSTNFDIIPQSAFSSLVVSLHLILKEDSFIFFTSCPGLEIQENYDDKGRFLLDFISKGFLPPNAFEDLKKVNLKWYDGGLICQIEDQRRQNMNVIRILLRLNNADITKFGAENESSYLLARYPYLSFDNDLQISRISRIAANDHLRWKENKNRIETPKEFVQLNYPSLFIENDTKNQDLNKQENQKQDFNENKDEEENQNKENARKLLFEKLAKLADE